MATVLASGSYDPAGFLVAFILAICLAAVQAVLYASEVRGRHRSSRLRKYRSGITAAVFIAFLAGLRRFVLHI